MRWLVQGFGYEITGLDVLDAFSYTMKAADEAGRAEETLHKIHMLVAGETYGERFVTKILGSRLGLA